MSSSFKSLPSFFYFIFILRSSSFLKVKFAFILKFFFILEDAFVEVVFFFYIVLSFEIIFIFEVAFIFEVTSFWSLFHFLCHLHFADQQNTTTALAQHYLSTVLFIGPCHLSNILAYSPHSPIISTFS